MVKRGEAYLGLLQAFVFNNINRIKRFFCGLIRVVSFLLQFYYNSSFVHIFHLFQIRMVVANLPIGFSSKRVASNVFVLKQCVRFYSTVAERLDLNVDAVKDLYTDRLAPAKPFTDKVVLSVSNILDVSLRAQFFSQLKDKGGGIYLFQYKHDPNVFYIGRTTQFVYRFRSHINHKLSDKFHVFGNLVGWDNFTVSIVEFCEKQDLGLRENYYLQKYLPLLNTTFSSKLSDTAIYETLTSKLKEIKLSNSIFSKDKKSIYKGVGIYIYKLSPSHIDPVFDKYSSLNKASEMTKIARSTLALYLDSNVPSEGLLFYSEPLVDFESSFQLVSESLDNFNISSNKSKKVWVYTIFNNEVELVNNEPFDSRGLAAKFLNTSHNVVRYFMDSWKGRGYNGYYLFSNPLNREGLESLLALYLSDSTPGKVKVWAYCANTLELINNSFFNTLKEAGNFFDMKYTTIAKHLDTELPTKQGGRLIYLFSHEIDNEMRDQLKNKDITVISNTTTEIWVYKKSNGEFTLLDNNQPFKSRLEATKALKISHKTLTKKLNTYIPYNELYFFTFPNPSEAGLRDEVSEVKK